MTDANERLLKSVAVVTGAGSGLGRALAQGLAARGVRVAAFGRRLEPLQETAAGHAGILLIACDVSDPLALTGAFAQAGHDLPQGSSAIEFAEIIQGYLKNPVSYAALRLSSRAEFEASLNWDAWGRRVHDLFEERLASGMLSDMSSRT